MEAPRAVVRRPADTSTSCASCGQWPATVILDPDDKRVRYCEDCAAKKRAATAAG